MADRNNVNKNQLSSSQQPPEANPSEPSAQIQENPAPVDATAASPVPEPAPAAPAPAPAAPAPAPAAPAPAPAAPAAPAPAGQVVLSGEEFAALMQRLSDLETTSKAVIATTPKNQALKIEELRRQGKLVKSVKLRKCEGKLVVGWRTLQDDVYFQDGRLVENQKVELKFADETSKELSLRQWATSVEYVPCDVLSEVKTSDGEVYLKVETPEGQMFEVNIIYVN